MGQALAFDVFISYARDDRSIAEPLKAILERLGLSVFYDVDGGVTSGDSFPQRIGDAVLDAKAVLAIWTPHSLTRPWCRSECYMAKELNKLIPAAAAPLSPADLKEFTNVSYEDLSDFNGEGPHFGWSQVLRSIAARMDAWAEANGSADSAEAIERAAKVRQAALIARPQADSARTHRGPGAMEKLWSELKDSVEPERLKRFAESFPGSTEAFEARERAAYLERAAIAQRDLHAALMPSPEVQRAHREALRHHNAELLVSLVARLRQDEAKLVAFIEAWPHHPAMTDLNRLRQNLVPLIGKLISEIPERRAFEQATLEAGRAAEAERAKAELAKAAERAKAERIQAEESR